MSGSRPGAGPPSEQAEPQAVAACERCGSPNARLQIGEHRLCEDCYHLYGSCCMEFGADDLWAD